jgi:hypothetical protein
MLQMYTLDKNHHLDSFSLPSTASEDVSLPYSYFSLLYPALLKQVLAKRSSLRLLFVRPLENCGAEGPTSCFSFHQLH